MIRSVAKDAGNVSGKRRELETMRMIVAMKPSCPMIVDVRRATRDEDAQGIDLVIDTPSGTLFVQVKSGKEACRVWRKKHGPAIGHKTMLVRWDGDRIRSPISMPDELNRLYASLTHAKRFVSTENNDCT